MNNDKNDSEYNRFVKNEQSAVHTNINGCVWFSQMLYLINNRVAAPHLPKKVETSYGNRRGYDIAGWLLILIGLPCMIYLYCSYGDRGGLSRVELQEKFAFTPANRFIHGKLIKDKRVETVAADIEYMCCWLRHVSHKNLLEMVEPSSFAFLLYGPPGTGKTTFVESVSAVLDRNIKERYLRESRSMYKTLIGLLSSNRLDEYVSGMQSFVSFLHVSPSLINDKYVGGSEKNVKALFDLIYDFVPGYNVRLIFFDECESFFKSRTLKETIMTSSESYVKSEFLSRISKMPDVFKPVFIFAATNLIDEIDTAFLRRFGVKEYFGLPTKQEREKIISDILKQCHLKDSQIEHLANKIGNRSAAFINRTCKRFIQYDEYGKFICFGYIDYVRWLDNLSKYDQY